LKNLNEKSEWVLLDEVDGFIATGVVTKEFVGCKKWQNLQKRLLEFFQVEWDEGRESLTPLPALSQLHT